MLKEKIKIIKIDPNYIAYLGKFDSKVQFNKKLLIKEYNYCMKHKEKIRKRAIKIYNMINLHTNINLEKRCCDFKLLEEKCKEYEEELLLKNR